MQANNPINPDAQLKAAQDLKSINDEYYIRQNPERYRAEVETKAQTVLQDLATQNRMKFQKAFNDLGKHFDMEDSTISYSNRNQDVINQNNHSLNQLNTSANSIKYNKDLSRRQVEINEWYYQDKLETLFFMQIFFMSMLSMSIIFYFRKASLITSRFSGYLTFILLLIVAITCFYRYFYTNQLRDSRWWYKRRFAKPLYIEDNKCGCVDDPFLPKKDPCPAKTGGKCISGMQGATSVSQAIRNRGVFSAVGTLLDRDIDRTATPNDTLNRAQEQLNAQTQSALSKDVPDTPVSSCPKKKKYLYNSDWFSSTPAVGQPGSSNESLNKNVLPYVGIRSYNKTKTFDSYLTGGNNYE